MKAYNIAVVEDVDREYGVTKQYLDRYAAEKGLDFRITRFSNAESFLENYRPAYDIVLMDIILSGMNGMEAAKLLRQKDPKVLLIFLTNMSDYAIRGYEVDAMGYVMKPVSYYGLAMYLTNAVRRIDTSNDVTTLVRSREGTTVLMGRDIYYIDIVDHDMVFHTAKGDITAYGSLNERESELKNAGFARCSAWALVNLRYVNAIYPDEVTVNGVNIRITRNKKKSFLEAFSGYLGRR